MPTRLIDLRPDRWLLRRIFRLPLILYRHGFGYLLGGRVMCMTHTGRRSGRQRHVAIDVLRHDRTSDAYIVAAAWGEQADWFRNLMARPEAKIEVGRRKTPALARRLSTDAARRELQLYALHHPIAFVFGFPLVFGCRPRSEADFQALAGSLPVLALQPCTPKDELDVSSARLDTAAEAPRAATFDG